jgi:hypothetical protein
MADNGGGRPMFLIRSTAAQPLSNEVAIVARTSRRSTGVNIIGFTFTVDMS